jgi:hypothetical protein
MFKTRRRVLTLGVVPGLLAAGAILKVAIAQKNGNSIPKQQRTLALGQDEVEQLLLLMDADKNGKISKKEFLDFMSAEFDRLDKDKSGELDPKELTLSQIRPSRPIAPVGK